MPRPPSPRSTLIRNARVIDPASGLDRTADIAIAGGRIAAIGPRLPKGDAAETIDAKGLIASPGLIDPHVHLREPGGEERETIRTGAAAGAMGGFTTLCCMPNTSPALDSATMVDFVLRTAAQPDDSASTASARGNDGADDGGPVACRVFPVGAVSKGRGGEELAEIALMARHGAVGFSDDGDAVASASLMAKALAAVKPTGLALMQHCQDPTMTARASMNAGPTATRLGLIGWPRAAEEVIIERDVRLNRSIGCRYHVQHISSAGSVEIVRRARERDAQGERITAEASPHHLLLTDDACDDYNTNAKMNPPLRAKEDVEALRAGVADGVITILATDHAPHTPESKATDFGSASFGIVGLESALALYVRALLDTGALPDWPALLALMTVNPARLCGLDRAGLGALAVGGPADVTLIDPDRAWTIRAADFAGKGRNTPFDRWNVRGRAVRTIVGGRTAWRLEG